MRDFFLKYWLLFFVICNIFAQYSLTSSFANYLFYILLAIGCVNFVIDINVLRRLITIKEFSLIYWFAVILICYQFTFGLLFVQEKTWTYLISKIIVNFALVISLIRGEEFYGKKFYPIIAIITSILLIYGYFMHNMFYGGRQTLGFGNPNSTGAISAICCGTMIILNLVNQKIKYITIFVCLLGVLLSGSRSAMGIIVISLLIKYGFNPKLVGVMGIIIIVIFWIFPLMDFHFVGLSRFTEAIASNDFSSGREIERESTIYMIKESPWIGNGIYSQQSEEASKISALGSHNAYLDFVKWFGLPLGSFLIGIILYYSARLYFLYRNTEDCAMRAHLFVVIGVLLAANYEAYIWGVNQMITTMYFLSISFLQKKEYDLLYYNEEDKDV